jgi:hypothetical protein
MKCDKIYALLDFKQQLTESIMDDKTKTHPLDNKRIDVHDANEVRNWTRSLGCTESELKNAVKAVGTSGAKVRVYLGK